MIVGVERINPFMLDSSAGQKGPTMTLSRKLSVVGIVFFAGLVIVFLGIGFFREMRSEKARSLFEDSSPKPSVEGLPSIEPMTKGQALIPGEIDGLSATDPEVSKRWYTPDVAPYWPRDVQFDVNYVSHSKPTNHDETVTVWVNQFPNEAWALYFAKHSPLSDLVPRNRSLVLSLARKFGNDVVVDRQFRFQDETGKLLFFWPSGKNFVTIIYYSPTLSEEFVRRYLEKYPSSL